MNQPLLLMTTELTTITVQSQHTIQRQTIMKIQSVIMKQG